MICTQPGKISLPLLFNNCLDAEMEAKIGYSKNERTNKGDILL